MNKEKLFNNLTQFALPCFTIGAQIAIAMKLPKWGLIIALAAQPFWLYSTWKSYKQAKQIGLFITTIIYILVTIFGIINYLTL